MFIVTQYGCNSSSNDMVVPTSKLFESYEEAYKYFLEYAPPLDDDDNEAEQYVNKNVNSEEDYVVIEYRVQLGGYNDGNYNRAKRPYGVVIAKIN